MTMKTEILKKEPTYQDLLNELICPVCLNYLSPPIRQCMTGHHCCEDCFKKIIRCPECRAPKSEARSFVLERLHSKLIFPCRFRDEGCTYIDNGINMKDHEDSCAFLPIRCPLRFNNHCKWTGKKSELEAHCLSQHPSNIYSENSMTFRCSKFTNNIIRKYYIIFSVFDEVFRCAWDMNEEKGLVRYGVYLLHKKHSSRYFTFKITINNKNSDLEAISMQTEIAPLIDDANRFEKDRYLMLKYNMLKDYCTDSGDLIYTISVMENGMSVA